MTSLRDFHRARHYQALARGYRPHNGPTASWWAACSATGRSATVTSPAASSPATNIPAVWYAVSACTRLEARATGTRASAPAEAFHAPAVTLAVRRDGIRMP